MRTIRLAHRDRFTVVANETIEDQRLSWGAKGVLVYLLSKPDETTVNVAELGEVQNLLVELAHAGYLVRDNVAKATTEPRYETVLYESPNTALPAANDDEDLAFIAFWSAYPKKVGKGTARKSWKRMSAENRELAIVAAIRFRDWPGRDPRFTPHPTTWLNREGWLDELEDTSPEEPAAWDAIRGAMQDG